MAGSPIIISLILLPKAIEKETGFAKPKKFPIKINDSSWMPTPAGIKKTIDLIKAVKVSIKTTSIIEISILIIRKKK